MPKKYMVKTTAVIDRNPVGSTIELPKGTADRLSAQGYVEIISESKQEPEPEEPEPEKPEKVENQPTKDSSKPKANTSKKPVTKDNAKPKSSK